MQVKLYWVVIIMDIFIIYAKYEESSTIVSIYIVHNVFFFFIVWKKMFLNTSACLPAKEMVLFLYCVLCFAVEQTTLFVV